jgi:hypothetical protein
MATQINTGASSGILTREEEHEHFVKGWMPGLELELCKLEQSCQPAALAKRQCSQTRRCKRLAATSRLYQQLRADVFAALQRRAERDRVQRLVSHTIAARFPLADAASVASAVACIASPADVHLEHRDAGAVQQEVVSKGATQQQPQNATTRKHTGVSVAKSLSTQVTPVMRANARELECFLPDLTLDESPDVECTETEITSLGKRGVAARDVASQHHLPLLKKTASAEMLASLVMLQLPAT